jgi:hypothetical protein
MTNETLIETLIATMIVKIEAKRAGRDPEANARIEAAVRRASAEIRGDAA